jgi:hypothetical protein
MFPEFSLSFLLLITDKKNFRSKISFWEKKVSLISFTKILAQNASSLITIIAKLRIIYTSYFALRFRTLLAHSGMLKTSWKAKLVQYANAAY